MYSLSRQRRLHHASGSHKNILPEFDPSSKNQRIDTWLKKVNECATVYGWDDRATVHFAMQKLQELAKTWYESLPSILFDWAQWQEKLVNAFPSEQNYGQSLEEMLKRRSRYNEPIEVYFYENLALLNQCSINGKHAVECIIHGLTDKTMRSSANTLRCSEPEQLLEFLMTTKETFQPFDRANFKRPTSDSNATNGPTATNTWNKVVNRNGVPNSSQIFCYNCKEKGHPFLKCPKPIVKCNTCNKMGHKTENCFSKFDKDNKSKGETVQKTL